jgi:toxin ParE1/3/4
MPSYRLSKKAENDILNIALYGDEQFGVAQSDKYREKLKAQLSTLAKNPLRYPAVNHIKTGYRRAVCGVHSIYYKIADDSVIEIVRIIRSQRTDNI